jgi:RNA polymerase sigma-70 factor (ECF subfamily)
MRVRRERRTDDRALVAAVQRGDTGALAELVRAHDANMRRVARSFVRSDELARDVVQETWAAVLTGLAGFRGEAAPKTWIFRILANKARRLAQREARTVAFADLRTETGDENDAELTDRVRGPGAGPSPMHGWRLADPELGSIHRQGVEILNAALDSLPKAQRTVVTMRDVEGFPSEEICALLDITPGNMRVLLHRGRARLRKALEDAERTRELPALRGVA